MKPTMNIKEHIKAAELIRPAYFLTEETMMMIQAFKPKNSSVMKKLERAHKLLNDVRCELDSDYHNVITDSQFAELGHIYYGSK